MGGWERYVCWQMFGSIGFDIMGLGRSLQVEYVYWVYVGFDYFVVRLISLYKVCW